MHYEILPGTASEYKLKIPPGDVGRKPDDYMIGIASEVRQASSGIIWAPCFHIKDVGKDKKLILACCKQFCQKNSSPIKKKNQLACMYASSMSPN